MTATELIRHLRRQGVSLWVEGERLRYRAPKGVLTPALRAELLAHKPEILDLLRAAQQAATVEPLERLPRHGLLPLSSIQERLWFLEQLEPGNPAYNIAMAWHLEGPVGLAALQDSLEAIVQRHEILRAACLAQDGRPGLSLSRELEPVLTVTDLGQHPHHSRESHALELARQEARRPFDLARPPLLRAQVLRLDADRCILVLVTHHFVADGWSMGILLHELSVLYESYTTGKPAPLPDLPVQYLDLVQQQRRQLTTGAFEEQLAFWVRRLQGAPALLELPVDRGRPPLWSYRGARHAIFVRPELRQALYALSRREGSTLFQTLLAAFQVLLYHYTRREDMIVGTAVSNRNRKEAENLIGSFANSLVLRTDLSGDPTFRALLERVRQVTWEAFAHQDLPFEQLVHAVQSERNTGFHPLYQVAFVLHQRREEQRLRLPGVTTKEIPIELGTARLDLFLEIWDHGHGLAGAIEYSLDLFEAATIGRIAGRFQSLLESLVADQEVPISRLVWETEPPRSLLHERRASLSPAKRALLEKRLRGATASQAAEQRIPRRGAQDPAPLSYVQERYWYLDQLEPANPTYNRPMALRLRGPLDVGALERSLGEILRRHEVLRTAYPSDEGQPVCVIRPAEAVPLPLVELDGLPLDEREPRARQLAKEEVRQPFDLAQGPLLRAKLLRLDEGDQILLLVMHHMVFDGWSATVLIEELVALYESYSEGRSSPLPEPPLQYADLACWQRQRLEGGALQAQLSYWLDRLAGSPASLELPTDRPRPESQSYQGGHHSLVLPERLVESLQELSRQQGVTLFVTLLAAFQVLLYRHTGQEDIVVGTPIAGRARLDTERLIGNLTNTLALRTDLSGSPRFGELLGAVRQFALEALAHQELPFENLLAELKLKRDVNRTPLFQVMFNFENVPKAAASQALEIEEFEFESGLAPFDLSLEIVERGGGLVCCLAYDSDLFDEGTIVRWLGHYRTLLEGIVVDPDRRLPDLPLLTEAEAHQLRMEWNSTQAGQVTEACVHEMFEVQAKRVPEAVAVVMGGQALTYGELNRRANRLAHHLQGLGVGPEVPVGICLERSPEMIVGLLAILKAGGAYVPLDPASPERRLGFMIQDTRMSVLLTERRFVAGLSSHQAHVVCLDADGEAIGRKAAEDPGSGVTSGNLAYIIYTSGSTGEPKGVMIEHRSLAGYTQTACKEFAISTGDRVLQFASISFDTAAEEIFPCLASGATLILRDESMLDSVAGFLARCRDWQVTVLDLPTAYWHQLVLELGNEAMAWPGTIRLVIIGGEKALGERLATWRKHVDSGVRLVNTYGPTEATVVATMVDLPAQVEVGDASQEVPIGRPIRNVQVYVLDRHSQLVPIGVAGELNIGGAGLARGYLNQPALTVSRFIPDPFGDGPGARLYRTGDLVRYHADGQIEFLRRLDDQVKIRGYRVELGEIEAVLRQHPDIRESIVLAREDAGPLRTDRRLEAYLLLEPGKKPGVDELRAFVRKTLPEYMVPVAFLFLDALPLTSSGKVDRRALLTLDAIRPEPSGAFAEPSTPTESLLAEVWQEVLGVDHVGVYDNFFDLGGHSLLSMQVIARVEEKLGVRINPRDMIRQSLGQLAALCDERSRRPEPSEQMSLGRRLQSTLRRLI